jgi:hypothetical protein
LSLPSSLSSFSFSLFSSPPPSARTRRAREGRAARITRIFTGETGSGAQPLSMRGNFRALSICAGKRKQLAPVSPCRVIALFLPRLRALPRIRLLGPSDFFGPARLIPVQFRSISRLCGMKQRRGNVRTLFLREEFALRRTKTIERRLRYFHNERDLNAILERNEVRIRSLGRGTRGKIAIYGRTLLLGMNFELGTARGRPGGGQVDSRGEEQLYLGRRERRLLSAGQTMLAALMSLFTRHPPCLHGQVVPLTAALPFRPAIPACASSKLLREARLKAPRPTRMHNPALCSPLCERSLRRARCDITVNILHEIARDLNLFP